MPRWFPERPTALTSLTLELKSPWNCILTLFNKNAGIVCSKICFLFPLVIIPPAQLSFSITRSIAYSFSFPLECGYVTGEGWMVGTGEKAGPAGHHLPTACPTPPSSRMGMDITTTPQLHRRTRSSSRIVASKWIESLWQGVAFVARLEYKIGLKMRGHYIVSTTKQWLFQKKTSELWHSLYFKVFKNNENIWGIL